jgi:hypothetical protein
VDECKALVDGVSQVEVSLQHNTAVVEAGAKTRPPLSSTTADFGTDRLKPPNYSTQVLP